jgi:hypothetical protein
MKTSNRGILFICVNLCLSFGFKSEGDCLSPLRRLPHALLTLLVHFATRTIALLLWLARASEALAEDISFLGGADCSSRVPAATPTAVCPQLRCRGRGIVLSPLLLLDLVGLLCI